MLDPKTQEALDSLKTFEIKPLTTDQLNGLTTVDLSNLGTTPSAVGAVGQGYTYTTDLSAGSINWQAPNTVWTTNTTGTGLNWSKPNPVVIDQAGKISLKGEKADIDINGRSMSDWMAKVEERLNILTPNPELEAEWDELRRLGERYRRLEKKCREKAETWKKLKAMPPPTVD